VWQALDEGAQLVGQRWVEAVGIVLAREPRQIVELPLAGLAHPVLTTAIRHHTIGVLLVYASKENLMRDAAINLRALPEQRDLIDHAAHLLGKNRSDFMLEAACDRAQSVVLDQLFFSLDADKFRQFTTLLDAPPAHNPGLERLLTVNAPWEAEITKA
jgi:uncharacterized protein (DUF1778 family)